MKKGIVWSHSYDSKTMRWTLRTKLHGHTFLMKLSGSINDLIEVVPEKQIPNRGKLYLKQVKSLLREKGYLIK